MERLDNVTQPYAWGSRTLVSGLQGRAASEAPEAEVWMGAHPVAPSKVGGKSLLDVISHAPAKVLGGKVEARFGTRLPYLLKLLAAGQPLSLQAHPSLRQAKEGFAREDAAGIPRTAAHRNYKDDNHKPELLAALTPFTALCGFRRASETFELLDALDVPALTALKTTADGAGLRVIFTALMSLEKDAATSLTAQVLDRCRAITAKWQPECANAVALGKQYPGDIGAVTSLMLNYLELQPGEAIYLPAGNLHAYLGGLGVEIMANSDNVLRGGLTPKHVDVPELSRVLDFGNGPVPVLRPTVGANGEAVYVTPAPEFRLSRFTLEGASAFTPDRRGAEVLLCTKGAVTAGPSTSFGTGSLSLAAGQSCFVAADEGPYTLKGAGEVFRATVNDLP